MTVPMKWNHESCVCILLRFVHGAPVRVQSQGWPVWKDVRILSAWRLSACDFINTFQCILCAGSTCEDPMSIQQCWERMIDSGWHQESCFGSMPWLSSASTGCRQLVWLGAGLKNTVTKKVMPVIKTTSSPKCYEHLCFCGAERDTSSLKWAWRHIMATYSTTFWVSGTSTAKSKSFLHHLHLTRYVAG